MIKIVVSEDDFSIDAEYRSLSSNLPSCGAVVTFTGLVREFSERTGVVGMRLEHYPGMTEKALENICIKASERWDIQRGTVIHRIGDLKTEEQIVFVGVASAHREDAFEACRFIMDYLKTEAPFWKKELTDDGEFWVEAREKDQSARERWRTPESD
ncbi:MAG: molybdopterin synthase catalytic subunit MoaE [Thalassolituus sp.]